LQTASLALSEFKALFPARNLAKGSHLELLYDAKAKTVLFQIKASRAPVHPIYFLHRSSG
jgi:hypothetical protein